MSRSTLHTLLLLMSVALVFFVYGFFVFANNNHLVRDSDDCHSIDTRIELNCSRPSIDVLWRALPLEKIIYIGTESDLECADLNCDSEEGLAEHLTTSFKIVASADYKPNCFFIDTTYISESPYLPCTVRNNNEHISRIPKLYAEAMDSTGTWISIEGNTFVPFVFNPRPKFKNQGFSCGVGNGIPQHQYIGKNELAITLVRNYNSGPYKTKIRYRSGLQCSNEYKGRIYYSQFRDRVYTTVDSHEPYELYPEEFYTSQRCAYIDLKEEREALLEEMRPYQIARHARLHERAIANLKHILSGLDKNSYQFRKIENDIVVWNRHSNSLQEEMNYEPTMSLEASPYTVQDGERKRPLVVKNLYLNSAIQYYRKEIDSIKKSPLYRLSLKPSKWDEEIKKDLIQLSEYPYVHPDDLGKEAKDYVFPEIQAQFPGGDTALHNFFAKKLRYPSEARKLGIEGRVALKFKINSDGTVSDAQIVRDIDGHFGNEVLRSLKNMPEWTPGKVKGQSVSSWFTTSVRFKL